MRLRNLQRLGENLQISETSLPGVLLIKPRVFEDPRGFFMETYRQNTLAGAGIRETFVQDNHSHSARGVLRGLHYQLRNPQAKLCRVTQGEVLDIAVDVRAGSPNFGKWVSVVLSGENYTQLSHPERLCPRVCGAIGNLRLPIQMQRLLRGQRRPRRAVEMIRRSASTGRRLIRSCRIKTGAIGRWLRFRTRTCRGTSHESSKIS